MADQGFTTQNNMPLEPSTLENIDVGFFEHIDEVFDPHANTKDGFVKVPVIWQSAERTFQIKNDRTIRDSVGKLKLPLITIDRTSVEKDPSFKGAIQADFRGKSHASRDYRKGDLVISKRMVKSKTRNFASKEASRRFGDGTLPDGGKQDYFPISNQKIVYEELRIPIPSYITIMYTIVLRTEYQQQMNDLLTPFITKVGNRNYFVFSKNNYSYEAFIQQDFAQDNNASSLGEEERSFTTKIQVKVLGYLIGDKNNMPTPEIVTREEAVELKMSRERVITGDKIPWKTKDNKYRE